MTQNSEFENYPQPAPAAPHQSFWQKLGGGSLTVAVLFHVILLLIGAVWVFQVIKEPEKKVDFMPPGGGGGERGAEHKVQQKKRAQITPTTNVKRVFAEGATATYSIPENGDNFGELSALSSLSGGGMSGGLGGSGTGNGFGKGDGLGGGLGTGGGKLSPFGMIDPNNIHSFVGTYYDLKFDEKHKQTKDKWAIPDLCKVYRRFFDRGWDERVFADFYRAPTQLSATRFAIPTIPAEKAPTFFDEKETANPAWCVLYKGSVSPPDSGTYRFVCTSDDAMAVRLDRKQVMSHHYCLGRGYVDEPIAGLFSKKMLPEDYIKHPANYPASRGHLACGEWFTVSSGRWYDCQILIMETGYGGANSAVLLLQKKGEEDKPLKLFHVDPNAEPVPQKVGNPFNIPPYDPASPQWQVKRADLDI